MEACLLLPAIDTLHPMQRWELLAGHVRTQRAYLGYSVGQLATIAGLSTSTVDNIEHGRKTSYDPATLSALERALRWRHQSIDRILNGLEPQPLEDPDFDAIAAVWPRLPPAARRMLRILAEQGFRAQN